MIKFSHSIFALPFALASFVLATGGPAAAGGTLLLVAGGDGRRAQRGHGLQPPGRPAPRRAEPAHGRRELPRGALSRAQVWAFVLSRRPLLVLAGGHAEPAVPRAVAGGPGRSSSATPTPSASRRSRTWRWAWAWPSRRWAPGWRCGARFAPRRWRWAGRAVLGGRLRRHLRLPGRGLRPRAGPALAARPPGRGAGAAAGARAARAGGGFLLAALWWLVPLHPVYLAGVAAVALLLAYEHSLVRPTTSRASTPPSSPSTAGSASATWPRRWRRCLLSVPRYLGVPPPRRRPGLPRRAPPSGRPCARCSTASRPATTCSTTCSPAGIDVRWRRAGVDFLALPPAGARVLDLCTGTADLLIEALRREAGSGAWASTSRREMLARGRAKLAGSAGWTGGRRCWAATRRAAAARRRASTARWSPSASATCRAAAGAARDAARAARGRRAGGAGVRAAARACWARSTASTSATCCRALGGLISGDRGAYAYLPASVERFARPEELAALMEQAGFADVLSRRLTGGIAWLHRGAREDAQ